MAFDVERARFNMIEQQIRPWDVLDQEVLDLLFHVRREDYVPVEYRKLAFADIEIPIGEGEKMWPPKIEARALQELSPKPTDHVLEIGTGSGYFTALLARRAAQVTSVEIRPMLAERARAKLEAHAHRNVVVEVGDGARGWGERTWDVVALTGSVPVLPRRLLAQLNPGGRLFAIVGDPPAMTARLVICTKPGAYRATELFETVVAPLVNAERPAAFTL